MEGAVKTVSTEDVLPLPVVLEEGAVVLGARDEPIHGERVRIDPIGLGNGQALAVVFGRLGIGIEPEGPAIVAHEQSAVRQEADAVLVRVEIGEVSARIPVACAIPGASGIGGFPEVDAAEEQAVRVRGVDGEGQVIPSLSPDVRAADGPAEQVGALAFKHAGAPAVTAVGAAPDSSEALV